jgi:hypothetical protein
VHVHAQHAVQRGAHAAGRAALALSAGASRSQGVAPPQGETVPQVCGCIPRCPASRRVLIAREGEGRWPDGSRKGRFSCATAGIPSAAPARGM